MSKNKNPFPEPLPFKEVDVVRKTMGWHMDALFRLHQQLAPHKTSRGTIGATNEKGDIVIMIFKGSVRDLFEITESWKKKDEQTN